MSASPEALRWRAVQVLILANVFWGLSFPIMKALGQAQKVLLPASNTWFVAALCVSVRFAVAALIMAVICRKTFRRITRSEIWQGLGLAVFAAAGLVFQMDGLAYTSASTSAFLTQCQCVIIPAWLALRHRAWPSPPVIVGCGLAVAGVAVLADLDWRTLRLGRGELETIIASIIFTGQILWLQRAKFRDNHADHFSLIMFGAMALLCAPIAWWTQAAPGDWLIAYSTPATIGWLGVLVIFCTLGAYRIMNHWQPHLTATQAGLIYCVEPVFASVFALFLPGCFSRWSGIDYTNEQLTASLLIGGGLITAANLIVQQQGEST
ncbi:MAG: DMT family transporter [Verrucomicrobia bacterium]|nr:DMT family transporter [Verrucomicrobiota bacterium]